MKILRPLLAETGALPVGKAVIGTVKGDIHDIGKNLVSMMWEGAGFEVIDLGINCPVEKYLAALEEHKPDILGMSALLTTTMPYMKVVIDTMKEQGIRDDFIILVGGAPLNEEFGDAWEREYYNSLYIYQKENWDRNLIDVEDPIQLIDYGNLRSFSLRQQDFFEADFGRGINNLPTIFNQMAEARNNLMHFLPFNNDRAQIAYLHMIYIAQKIKNPELENELRKLKNDSFGAEQIKSIYTSRAKTKISNNERLYTNRDIQIKITDKAKTLTEDELENLCDKDYSHETFNNNYSIFIRVPENTPAEVKDKAKRDHNGSARWTWRYEIKKFGNSYAVTTQWYPRNDEYVKEWLNSK
jgi:methylmalonyl-CoA mutase cobalamin-binding domain/chain